METPRSLIENLITFRSGDAKRLWRESIKARDEYCCVYCGSTEDLTIDHVVPKCRSGPTSSSNCVTACRACNLAKGSLKLEDFILLQTA